MSKPTPGPWRIGTPGPNGCYTVGTENGLMVAMVAQSANQLDQCEQAIGDALLIAAAPELLEACVVLIEWDEREKDHAVNFHARMALCDAALLKARAAIAKAEGR